MSQLWNIAGYYAALLPFFFLAGLYISLCFVLNDEDIGRVYGFDLTGAGAGALAVLGLMCGGAPVPPGALPAGAARARRRLRAGAARRGGGGWRCWRWPAARRCCCSDNRAAFNDFKAIYAPLHVPDSRGGGAARLAARPLHAARRFHRAGGHRRVQQCRHARPAGPAAELRPVSRRQPAGRAAERPGRRRPMPARRWRRCPIVLHPHGRVLLVGASGGFRIAEARALGAARGAGAGARAGAAGRAARRVRALAALCSVPAGCGFRAPGRSPPRRRRRGAGTSSTSPSDFLDAAEANASAFAAEAIAAYLRALAPGGMVSIPVSIREFPAYAVRMLATVRAGLRDRRHRRSAGACAGHPLGLERAHPGVERALRRGADRGGANSSATNGHSTSAFSPASTSPPRAPTSTTTCRRCPSRPAR